VALSRESLKMRSGYSRVGSRVAALTVPEPGASYATESGPLDSRQLTNDA
jgi:hypothetical protein